MQVGSVGGPSRSAGPNRPAVVAAVLANALEWYDFTVYGYFAVVIAKQFFPRESDSASLLAALAVFGVAFIVRPFGGIVLGHVADVVGRRAVLIAIAGLMALGTAVITVAPPYAAIGVAAPILMVAARMLQGFSAGAEFASVSAFLVELAPPHRRGLYGSWQGCSQAIASVLAGFAGWATARCFEPSTLEDWGWRIPFAVGLLIGPIGVYLRLRLEETPQFVAARRRASARAIPLTETLRRHKRRLLVGFGLVLGGTATVYVMFLFMPIYATQVLKLDPQAAYLAPMAAGAALALCAPWGGWLSDRTGRRSTMLSAVLVFLALLLPLFQWLNAAPSAARLLLIEAALGVVLAGYIGPLSTAIVELFPPHLRSTAVSLAYNLAVGLFGGFAPMIVTWLIARTGTPLAPAFYVMAALSVSAVALFWLPHSIDRTAEKASGAG